MAEFNRAEYIAEKVEKFGANVLGIASNCSDPVGLSREITKFMENALNEAIDHNVKDASEADKKFAELQKKNMGIYMDGKFVIIDMAMAKVKFNGFPIDISGSSMDEGNDKLYPVIEKSELSYIIKRAFGNVIDVLVSATRIGAIISAVVDIPGAISGNHPIRVDYKDKETDETQERKYILYDASSFVGWASLPTKKR